MIFSVAEGSLLRRGEVAPGVLLAAAFAAQRLAFLGEFRALALQLHVLVGTASGSSARSDRAASPARGARPLFCFSILFLCVTCMGAPAQAPRKGVLRLHGGHRFAGPSCRLPRPSPPTRLFLSQAAGATAPAALFLLRFRTAAKAVARAFPQQVPAVRPGRRPRAWSAQGGPTAPASHPPAAGARLPPGTPASSRASFTRMGFEVSNNPFMSGHEPLVGGCGSLPLARRAQIHDLLHARRRHVADGGHDAHAAELHDVVGGRVVARIHHEPFRSAVYDGLDLIHLAGQPP